MKAFHAKAVRFTVSAVLLASLFVSMAVALRMLGLHDDYLRIAQEHARKQHIQLAKLAEMERLEKGALDEPTFHLILTLARQRSRYHAEMRTAFLHASRTPWTEPPQDPGDPLETADIYTLAILLNAMVDPPHQFPFKAPIIIHDDLDYFPPSPDLPWQKKQ